MGELLLLSTRRSASVCIQWCRYLNHSLWEDFTHEAIAASLQKVYGQLPTGWGSLSDHRSPPEAEARDAPQNSSGVLVRTFPPRTDIMHVASGAPPIN